jgi:hypothetical protein
MPTDCSANLFGFAPVEGREVVAAFDGGAITSDAGGLLLSATDRALDLMRRLTACFSDVRKQHLIEHEVVTLIAQRVFAIALGYEDLNDHDKLRKDPVMAVLAGKLAARRQDCEPVAGKSTLNRLELSRPEPTRYHKISHDPAAIESLFVTLFLQAHKRHPGRSFSISTRPMIRCMASKRGASSADIMITTAICRSMSFAAATCWRPSCGPEARMQPPGR